MARQKLSHTVTKIGFKALQAKKHNILLALFLLVFGSQMYAQETPKKQSLPIKAANDSINVNPQQILTEQLQDTVITDTTKTDSIAAKKPFLEGNIVYKAKDYVKMSRKQNCIYLYNEAEVYYQDYELKAGIIIIDYTKNEVYAGRIKDSAGNYSQLPFFKQGSNEIKPDSIRFNFDTKRAITLNSRTEQNLGDVFNVYAERTKKENDSTYYLKEAKLTTSKNPDDPEYYIRVRSGKFVPGKKIIAGFSNMYIMDVPTPIGVPFAYFPVTEDQRSGFIMPTPGQVNNRGYFLQNGGYYFAISDKINLTLLGDYYTNGSYGFRAETEYAIRYKFRGAFRFRFENLINSQRGFDDFSRTTIYNVQWNHSKDQKSNPSSSFSASVNLGSSRFFQESFNQINTSNFLTNTLQSSISYNKNFPAYPSVNLNTTISHSQNTQSGSVNMTLPTLQASIERIFPFAKRDGIKKGILQNINFQYNLRTENRIETTDEDFLTSRMFENARVGFRHSIPVATNFKILKYFSTTLSANYDDVWQLKTIRRRDFDPELNTSPIDTINGFDRFNQYNFSVGIGTTLYGTFKFGDDKKIQAIRHTIRPSVSYGYTPGFDQYYDEYIANEAGDVRQYTRFEGGIFGVPGLGNSSNLNLSVSNVLEAKVRNKDTTATEPKKIMLLNNLNFNTAYNFVADSLKWSPVRMTGGTALFDGKMSINFGATLDPYALNSSNQRINTFNINNGGSLFRLTNANINMGYSLSSKSFSGKKDTEREDPFDNPVDEELFGRGRDFSDARTYQGLGGDENAEETPAENYQTKIPWDLRLAYTLNYSNDRRQNEINSQSLMFSGNIQLTPRWKVGASSGYDFKNKGFTFTRLNFERDLESWRLNFDWTPIGPRAAWYFFIGIKSSVLQDLKWDKRREPDRRL